MFNYILFYVCLSHERSLNELAWGCDNVERFRGCDYFCKTPYAEQQKYHRYCTLFQLLILFSEVIQFLHILFGWTKLQYAPLKTSVHKYIKVTMKLKKRFYVDFWERALSLLHG